MSVRPRVVASIAVLLVAIVLLGNVASAATFRVRGGSTARWIPKTLSVPTGSRVVWKIVGGTHNVTAISRNWNKSSRNIGAGGTTAFTFNRRGRYRYRCTLHSSVSGGTCNGMCGKVVVG